MKRLSALILCLVPTGLASAAPAGKDRQVLLDVQPAAAPVPALKYQLLPEVAEMNPGNAVPAYLKCFAEQNSFFFSKESVEERERLLKCPLTDIKPGSLKGYGGSALKQADHAARLEYADWNLLPQLRQQGYALLIPEVQQMRTLANALAVRCRGQIVDRDFDGAVGSLKTMFAMARHLGEHPTFLSGLVGLAIAQIGFNLTEELIQQPGAPSLYWALTGLPDQLVDLHKAASAERTITEYSFGDLLDRKRIWTAEETPGVVQKFKELASIVDLKGDDREAADRWMQMRLKDADWLAATRKELTESGYPADRVAKFPAEQVMFHHLFARTRLAVDEAHKWILIPYHLAATGLAELDRAPADIEEKMARLTVSAIPRLKAAHVRAEQRLDLLRVAEAIRLDAAKNGGKLPAALGDLSVPVPADPASGKAFEYKVDGMTAMLSGRPTPVSGGGTMQYRYEIRLRK